MTSSNLGEYATATALIKLPTLDTVDMSENNLGEYCLATVTILMKSPTIRVIHTKFNNLGMHYGASFHEVIMHNKYIDDLIALIHAPIFIPVVYEGIVRDAMPEALVDLIGEFLNTSIIFD